MHAGALAAALTAVVVALIAPAPAGASTALCNVPLEMSVGIVLRANLWLPSAPDGSPAAGTYPTVLTATGCWKMSHQPPWTTAGMSSSARAVAGGAQPEPKNRWFDHWLQGADNGVENAPSVSLYPIGGDGWETIRPGRCPG